MTVLKNCALFAGAVVISLIIGEQALRFMFDDITTTYDNRSYFAINWKKTKLHLNSMGYREREFERVKSSGSYRIAVIGDSFTFGQGIDEQERVSNILESELRQHRSGVEVLNFGKPGNNTVDEVRELQTDVLSNVDPDFVLLQWFVNDIESNPHQVNTSESKADKGARDRWNEFKQMMLNESVIYFLLADVVHRARAMVGMSYAEEVFARVGDPSSKEFREAKEAMHEFVKACKEKNVPLGILLVPDLAPLGEKQYPFLFLHHRVMELCQREAVSCVDLLPIFEPYLRDPVKYRDLWVNRFDSHMGSLANHLASTRLLQIFGPVWTASRALAQAH